MVSCRVTEHASDAGSERLDLTLPATDHLTTPCAGTCPTPMREIDTAVDTTLNLGCEQFWAARG
jgi:hypothetical protein